MTAATNILCSIYGILRAVFCDDLLNSELLLKDPLVNYVPESCRVLSRLKEFTHYFAGNYTFGHVLSSRIQSSNSVEEARERAAIFFENNRFLQSWNGAATGTEEG